MEREPVYLSLLNQYSYCPRRAALILQEREFADNRHTLKGNQVHERVDEVTAPVVEGMRIEYALPVWSDRLGLSGKCDAVEFWPDGKIYPVEYKKGKKERWINDDLQLAAQAMCLEEMLGAEISEGAIYHYESRHRREVAIGPELRGEVERVAGELHRMAESALLPPPINNYRCPECSLRDICLPEAMASGAAREKLYDLLFDET